MSRNVLFKRATIMFILFFMLIIVPSVFFGRMWGQYEAITENPELFGLVGYVLNSPDAILIGYAGILFVIMMILIFKIGKGRIT